MDSHQALLDEYRVQTTTVNWSDSLFYGLGAALLVVPFLGRMIGWFGLVTLAYIVAVFVLLVIERAAPHLIPNFARFVTDDQEIREAFDAVLGDYTEQNFGQLLYHVAEFAGVSLEFPLRLGMNYLVRGPTPPR